MVFDLEGAQNEAQLLATLLRVFVEKHPDFERSDGELVERSWLRLQALPPDNEHIGLGAMKCRAIAELEEELKRWVAGGCGS
jgi:hypothetical protein